MKINAKLSQCSFKLSKSFVYIQQVDSLELFSPFSFSLQLSLRPTDGCFKHFLPCLGDR